jgi:sugar lactone lactonase YvrE
MGPAPLLVVCAILLAGCTTTEGAPDLPHWSFEPDAIFPADRSLTRPEDGAALPDGRLIVADQLAGLRLVEVDGTSRPFGTMATAGYVHRPPEHAGGPNGVALEPDGAHVLVADVFRGGIYRVDVATGATERVYQHTHGVNTAVADKGGGIWFTQSTRNGPQNGEEELFASVAVPVADGALFHLPPAPAGGERRAVQLVDGLLFANGVVLDEERGVLYVAETMASRVWRFRFDAAAGTVSDRTLALEVDHPDNLELDDAGRLWIASPIRNELVVFDASAGSVQSVIRISTPESDELVETIAARTRAGEPWLDLMVPALWEPGPGLVTGLILSPESGPVYMTGLGNALVRLER